MTGPKRLLDFPGLGHTERLALEEARAMEPPPELRDEVWRALEAAIVPAAAGAMAATALSEGGSAGSHAVASTVAGGKAAGIGAATHAAFAVLPALKIVVAAVVVLGSTAGVGFAVGRGWSALTQRDAHDEDSVAEGHRAAASSRATVSPASAIPARGLLHEPLRAENTDEAHAVLLSAPAAVAPEGPRADASEAIPGPASASMANDGAHALVPAGPTMPAGPTPIAHAAAPVLPKGSGGAAAVSSGPVRALARSMSAPSAEASQATAAAVPGASAGASTGAPIYGADPESLLAGEAREALRAGDPRRSLALLQRMRELGSAGVLVQERALLEIEALVQMGDRDAARERARAFLQTWPESVYSGRVQAMLRRL
jgi:hypothetical protein